MSNNGRYTFKVAISDDEFEQISRLNYETFVEELPQREPNGSRRLVDRFHDQNTYFVCLRGQELVGMVAVRDERPFSLDQKLDNLDEYLDADTALCEIRLLSVRKELRSGPVLRGLLSQVARHCRDRGYRMALISGSVKRLALYEKLGFVPFGPVVGDPEALFQPMYRRMDTIIEDFQGKFHASVDVEPKQAINLLPGPVAVSPGVTRAFNRAPVSHRSAAFMSDAEQIRERLRDLVHARHAEILLGSGTLANDAVAGQLSLLDGRGLVLSNGEFGDRLLDHARRFGLDFDEHREEWGRPFDGDAITRALSDGQYEWVWAVHCETSTGVLNDLDLLKSASARSGAPLVLDCISSIGITPVDLSGVYLASGVSGKGLGAYPGLSMVFYNHELTPQPDRLPRYLDIGLLADKNGVPFTTSSNLFAALHAALEEFDDPATRFNEINDMTAGLRSGLRGAGFPILAADAHAAPAVITIPLPGTVDSVDFGERMEQAGYTLSCNSEYLRARNWVQVCLMGQVRPQDLERLAQNMEQEFNALRGERPAPQGA